MHGFPQPARTSRKQELGELRNLYHAVHNINSQSTHTNP
jgi:hypothetical protein